MSDKCVLVVSPHPDDLEIGMGGTVAGLIESGVRVVSVVVTDGRRSTSVEGYTEDEMACIREEEVKESAGILGLHDLRLFGLADIRSERDQALMMDKIEELILSAEPYDIYIPHPTIDKHPTHRIVSARVLEKVKELSAGGTYVPDNIWCYEVWTPFQEYDHLEDISRHADLKGKAIEAHKSQLQYKHYTEGILGLNRYRAIFNERHGVTEMKYAEVFQRLNADEYLS